MFRSRQIFTLLFILAFVTSPLEFKSSLGQDDGRERAQALLENTPGIIGWGYDPAQVIRVVNYLHALGQDAALAELEEFATRHRRSGLAESNYGCLQIIIPLLFVRNDPNEKLPVPIGGYNARSRDYELSAESWSTLIVLEQGIPFHTRYIGGMEGAASFNDLYLVDWATDHATIRESPLVPTDDLIAATENVLSRPGVDSDEWTKDHLRQQAYEAVSQLVQENSGDRSFVPYNDQRWELFKAKVKRMNIRWDHDRQYYVANVGRGAIWSFMGVVVAPLALSIVFLNMLNRQKGLGRNRGKTTIWITLGLMLCIGLQWFHYTISLVAIGVVSLLTVILMEHKSAHRFISGMLLGTFVCIAISMIEWNVTWVSPKELIAHEIWRDDILVAFTFRLPLFAFAGGLIGFYSVPHQYREVSRGKGELGDSGKGR